MAKNSKITSSLPFLFILICMLAVYLFAYFYSLSWENFKDFHFKLKAFADQHAILTPLLFMAAYILYAVLSLPGIFILSLLGGYLFTQPFSTLYVVFSATCGATFLFLAARTAFKNILYRRTGPWLHHMQRGFLKNSASYLLFLRLIPFFPFWLVNLSAAFFGTPLLTFIWTTFIGMLPSVFIFTEIGKGLALLIDNQESLTISLVFQSRLLWALLGLAILSLIPLLVQRFKLKV